ncbi:MAG: AraC family transcriptional regulator [Bacteroidota bacterium]|nr:AraC family transcriptional regulator [Bacteroidota bacterium]
MSYALSEPLRVIDLTSDDEPIRFGMATHNDITEASFDMHYEVELGIVCSGSFERFVGDRSIIYEPGQIWLHGIWEPHGFNLLAVPCKVIVIIFRPEIFRSIRLWNKEGFEWLTPFFTPAGQRPQVSKNKIPEVFKIVEQIESFHKGGSKYNSFHVQLLLLELLLLLHENGSVCESKYLDAWETFSDIQPALQLLYRTKGFISENDAAKTCGVSKSLFNKRFYDVMKMTFSKFALHYRVKNAEALLINSDIPIKEISDEEGFSDLSHFYRCFKQFYHCSPVEYRKSKRKRDV